MADLKHYTTTLVETDGDSYYMYETPLTGRDPFVELAEKSAKDSKEAADLSKGYKDEAKTFRDDSEKFKNAAKTSETNAKTSETNAKTSETNSKTSETNADNSENAAGNSQKSAETAAIRAEKAAVKTEDAFVGRGDWSPKQPYPEHFNVNGMWYVKEKGTKDNITYTVGDYLVWNEKIKAWGQLTGDPVTKGEDQPFYVKDDLFMYPQKALRYKRTTSEDDKLAVYAVGMNKHGNLIYGDIDDTNELYLFNKNADKIFVVEGYDKVNENPLPDKKFAILNERNGVPRTGGTFSGDVGSDKTPTKDWHLTRKDYVDKQKQDTELKAAAMSKAAFFSLAEKRKRDRAGSGFDEWGKHSKSGDTNVPINQGLWSDIGISNELQLGIDSNISSVNGVSRSKVAIAIVDGVQFTLNSKPKDSYPSKILFPPAPDGTKTYDSKTGKVTKHATSNEAFEGLLTNGDFRKGAVSWVVYAGAQWRVKDGIAYVKAPDRNGRLEQYISEVSGNGGYIFEVHMMNPKTNNGKANISIGGQGYIDIPNDGLVHKVTYETTSSNDGWFRIHPAYAGAGNEIEIYSCSVRPKTESVITSRKDLVFLETWLEDISKKDIVVPFGNVQYGAATYEGITTYPLTDYSVNQGYSAFGEWDKKTIGRGNRLSLMRESDKKKYLTDSRNNIFYDSETDRFLQWRYRVRAIEGLGDNWGAVRPNGNVVLSYGEVGSRMRVKRQGEYEASKDFTTDSGTNGFFGSRNNYALPQFAGDDGIFHSNIDKRGHFALPIALVQRLNQGAYSPEFNSQGCRSFAEIANGKAIGRIPWHDSRMFRPISHRDCFDIVSFEQVGLSDKAYAADWSGAISDGSSGRSGNYKDYDAIYAGLVEDLRLSSRVQDTNKLLEDTIRKSVAGTMRGKGKVPFLTQPLVNSKFKFTANNADISPTGLTLYVSSGVDDYRVAVDGKLIPYPESYGDRLVISWDNNSKFVYLIKKPDGRFRRDRDYPYPDNVWHGLPWSNNQEITANWLRYDDLTAEYDSLPYVSIIGDPTVISEVFPNGLIGEWIPKIPTAAAQNFFLSRKCNESSTFQVARNPANGLWQTGRKTVNAIRNEIVFNGDKWIGLNFYESLSDFTEQANNSVIVGDVGNVFVGMNSYIDAGNRFIPSISGVIGKDGDTKSRFNIGANKFCFASSGVFNPNVRVLHEHIDLKNPSNDSQAAKALYTITEKDGLLYAQFHGIGMKYVADTFTPWGDNEIILIIDDESLKQDTNGSWVKAFCHHLQIPIGIHSTGQSSQSPFKDSQESFFSPE